MYTKNKIGVWNGIRSNNCLVSDSVRVRKRQATTTVVSGKDKLTTVILGGDKLYMLLLKYAYPHAKRSLYRKFWQ
jgi:hypothetical protein